MIETKPWPVEVRVKTTEKLLEIDFEDGKTFSLPAEFLRVESPSAEVQGHGVNQKTLISIKCLIRVDAGRSVIE